MTRPGRCSTVTDMSTNRENVTWQSVDGTWNIGFFTFYETNLDDPDRDYEWDVEYDTRSFWFVSSGHRTPDAAYEAYCQYHSNPGGTYIVSYDYENPALSETDRYERMASVLRKQEAEARERMRAWEHKNRRVRGF